LVRDFGAHNAMILRNHGLLTCGASVAQAFDLMYYLERACQTQLGALAGAAKVRIPSHEVAAKVAHQFANLAYKARMPDWLALRRMLDRTQPDYRQ
jgi:ribulose-5-phosphate 4-epimerase/fuculose-1-phosphate aldolase